MSENYSWIPIYKEIAEKLIQFQGNHEKLVETIYKIKMDSENKIELNSIPDGSEGNGTNKKLTDMDPFTFFACFNGGISANSKRDRFLKLIKSELNLSSNIPKEYKGIPVLDSNIIRFFDIKLENVEKDINRLWKLFLEAVNGSSIGDIGEKLFNRILNMKGIKIAKLTIALYWVKPDKYISLDSKNIKYLEDKYNISAKGIDTYSQYKELLNELNINVISKKLTIPQLSYIAHRTYKNKINYWKISPGGKAWNWKNCFNNGFIAMGWDEFGDLSKLTKEEFAENQEKLEQKFNGYSKQGTNQLWKFAHEIEPGDKIIANRGQKKVLGIGEVIGNYYFDEDSVSHEFEGGIERHAHKIPVDWYDTEVRIVNEKSWIGTINKLDEEKFEKIVNKVDKNLSPPFDKIFPNFNKALWVFDLLKESMNRLGIKDLSDQRYSVTYNKGTNRIRLNAGNFAIIHFTGSKNNDYRIGLSLLDSEESFEARKVWDPFESFDETIRITEFMLAQFENQKNKVLDIYYKTLDYIEKYIHDWGNSHTRKQNRPEIAEAIFDEDKRRKLLLSGFKAKEIQEQRYFWITANPSMWTPTKPEYKQETFYTAINKNGNQRHKYKDFSKAQPGDKIIFYESSPTQEIVATGKVIQGIHKELENGYDEKVPGISIRCENEVDGITWKMINDEPILQESQPVINKAQGSLFEITKQEYETILDLKPILVFNDYSEKLEIDILRKSKNIEIESLHFQNKKLILKQIHTALKTGKHIILNGPPGTGKSKLAKKICEHYCDENYMMATATSDWTTFDTIGGLMPNNKDGNKLEFHKNIFLRCFQDEYDNPDNKWLILDEINRADIDKAFGALFSALTGDKVTLPQKRNEIEIEIIGDVKNIYEYKKRIKEENIEENSHKFIIHPDWRIIATMNTFDKASLYEMSYAFMRRFAFINIGLPDNENINVGLLKKYLDLWDNNGDIQNSNIESNLNDISELWTIINKEFRAIGPAIIEDIIRYTSARSNIDKEDSLPEAITDSIAMYVIPQFEGLSEKKIKEFYTRLEDEDYIHNDILKKVIEDFFQIKLKEEEENSA